MRDSAVGDEKRVQFDAGIREEGQQTPAAERFVVRMGCNHERGGKPREGCDVERLGITATIAEIR